MKLYRLKPSVEVIQEFEIMKADNYYFVHVEDDTMPTEIGYYPEGLLREQKNDLNFITMSVTPDQIFEVDIEVIIIKEFKESGEYRSLINYLDYLDYVGFSGDIEDLTFIMNKESFLKSLSAYTFTDSIFKFDDSLVSLRIKNVKDEFRINSKYIMIKEKNVDTFKARRFRLKTLDIEELKTEDFKKITSSSSLMKLISKEYSFIDKDLTYYRSYALKSNYNRTDYHNYQEIRDNNSIWIRYSDLEEVDYSKKDEREFITWGREKELRYNIYNDYLLHQIRTRYAMCEKQKNGLSNIVIDSFAPRALFAGSLDQEKSTKILNPTKTSVAISPFIANMFGVKQIEMEQLCRVLGYDKKMIKSLFDQVKREKFSIFFIGYGGTNINTVFWLSEMAKMTNSINVFENTYLFEKEEVEFSNLLRFPIDPTTIRKTSESSNYKNLARKTNMLGTQLERLTKSNPIVINEYYNPESTNLARKEYSMVNNYPYAHYKDNDNQIKIKNNKMIIYGAPNIATRQELSKYGNFVSATHGDNGCMLYLNPEQNTTLQVESYGIIQLTAFFMNQIRMAIGFLELLTNPEIDFQEKDKHIMSYEFKGLANEEVGSSKKTLKLDREYNFQVEHSGLILTEEQARNITN